jgi:hypothetical protein
MEEELSGGYRQMRRKIQGPYSTTKAAVPPAGSAGLILDDHAPLAHKNDRQAITISRHNGTIVTWPFQASRGVSAE